MHNRTWDSDSKVCLLYNLSIQSANEENMVYNYCPYFKEYINNFLCSWIRQRMIFFNDLEPLGWIHTKLNRRRPFSKKGAAQLGLEFGSSLEKQ